MDNVSVFDKALTSTEVLDLYNQGGNPLASTPTRPLLGGRRRRVG